MIRRRFSTGLVVTCAILAAHAAHAESFNIPGQDLATALESFARQADKEVLFDRTQLQGMVSHTIQGEIPALEALKLLIDGNRLTIRKVNERTFIVGEANRANATPGQEALRVAQSDPTAGSVPIASQQTNVTLEEIVVTAQKREERLQDVPVPVTVINGESLTGSGQVRIQDYYSRVPGLTLSEGYDHALNLSIRGIATGSAGPNINPTVAITVDDVPYGGSWTHGQASAIPDFDPGDLARVEVLRGPQGTLYGASSIGGLLKFVTVDPSTAALAGRAEAGIDGVYHGSDPGYSFRGSVNVPLTETFALRASAFTRRDAGYIDNPALHLRGVNEERVSGGRLAALWRPSDILSLKLSALVQDDRGDGQSDINVPTPGYPRTLGLRALEQNYAPGTGKSRRKTQAYSAVVTAKLGAVSLTATTGYNINSLATSADYSDFFASYTTPNFGSPDTLGTVDTTVRKFSQELRLAASIGPRLDWLLGVFYTHEYAAASDPDVVVDPTTGARVAQISEESYPGTYTEYAAFGDLTLHLTDRFDVQVGARAVRNQEVFKDTTGGVLYGNVVATTYYPVVKNTPVTYLFTPRYKFSPNLVVYARLASGYRPGGPNYQPPAVFNDRIPSGYAPDKTYNYEIGAKGDFLDHRLAADISAYYIKWNNVQVNVTDPAGTEYTANSSQARSQGLELSLQARPTTGLTLAGWVTWGEAVLTSDFPSTSGSYGVSGNRLPFTTRFTGNLSIDQDIILAGEWTAFCGGVVSYTGDRLGIFTATAQRQNLPGYAKVDLRTGIRYRLWTASLYANNVTDQRGLLSGGQGTFFPYSYYFIQPRTVGLNIVRTF